MPSTNAVNDVAHQSCHVDVKITRNSVNLHRLPLHRHRPELSVLPSLSPPAFAVADSGDSDRRSLHRPSNSSALPHPVAFSGSGRGWVVARLAGFGFVSESRWPSSVDFGVWVRRDSIELLGDLGRIGRERLLLCLSFVVVCGIVAEIGGWGGVEGEEEDDSEEARLGLALYYNACSNCSLHW